MALGAAACVAAAAIARLAYTTDETRLSGVGLLLAAPFGLGLLFAAWPDAAREAVRAWGGPFYAFTHRPAGDGLRRFVSLLPWTLSTAVCWCGLYALALVSCSLLSGTAAPAACTPDHGTDPVHFRCAASDGTPFRLALPASKAGAVYASKVRARRGPLGLLWFVDLGGAAGAATQGATAGAVPEGFHRATSDLLPTAAQLGPTETFVDGDGRRLTRTFPTPQNDLGLLEATTRAVVGSQVLRCDGDEARATCVSSAILGMCRRSGPRLVCATTELRGDEKGARKVAENATR